MGSMLIQHRCTVCNKSVLATGRERERKKKGTGRRETMLSGPCDLGSLIFGSPGVSHLNARGSHQRVHAAQWFGSLIIATTLRPSPPCFADRKGRGHDLNTVTPLSSCYVAVIGAGELIRLPGRFDRVITKRFRPGTSFIVLFIAAVKRAENS